MKKTTKDFLKKLVNWFAKTEPITALSAKVVAFSSLYILLSAVVPPKWTAMLYESVFFVLMIAAMGSLALHVVLGPMKALKPMYSILYRITGNEFYLDPFNYQPPVTVEEVKDVN